MFQKKQVSGLIDSLTLLQTNINGKPDMAAVDTAISTAIAALVDGAPTALDTLKELATMLQSEETALNSLLLTVDGKVAKTDVTNHIDATNGGFLADGTVASYSNILWLRSLHTDLADIVGTLTDQVAAKVSKDSITDLAGVTPDEDGRIAGFASVEALESRISDAENGLTGKVSGIYNTPIHSIINWEQFNSFNEVDCTLPADSNQVLEVKLNGQVFPVGPGHAFSIYNDFGAASTLEKGKYLPGYRLVIEGTRLGFNLETTDKIYATVVSTL